MSSKSKQQSLCCMCQKHYVKDEFSTCKKCDKEHKVWKIKKEQEEMRGNKVIRIMKCVDCDGDSFRFIWKYDKESEFNMIWCHEGIGFELDQARKICTKCGSKKDVSLKTIDDIFGEWIERIENE